MSNEIRVQASLNIKASASSLQFQSQPTGFTANMTGGKGPTPGAITVTVQGTDVNLTQLVYPGGMVQFQNLDLVNFVTIGIYDPASVKFYPLFEVLPGEVYTMRLSRALGIEYGTGAGTGTDIEGRGDTLRLKASNAPVNVVVNAFDA